MVLVRNAICCDWCLYSFGIVRLDVGMRVSVKLERACQSK